MFNLITFFVKIVYFGLPVLKVCSFGILDFLIFSDLCCHIHDLISCDRLVITEIKICNHIYNMGFSL